MTAQKDEQDKYTKEGDRQKAAFEKDPVKATEEGQRQAMEQLKEQMKAMGVKEDINSMVHPDGDDPVEARGSGKAGVPAGTEDYEKAQEKAQKKAQEHSKGHSQAAGEGSGHDAAIHTTSDKNADATVAPDGSKRTKDGVQGT